MPDRTILTNIRQLRTPGRTINDPVETIESAAMVFSHSGIEWVGKQPDLPSYSDCTIIDCTGNTVTPGLIDCHTHLVFAGNRSTEFFMRTSGKSYSEIAAEGGGIKSTVHATRQASFQDLLRVARKRLNRWIQQGVTTIEIKSGYGLDEETEIRTLKVIGQVSKESGADISPTYMGAHEIPPGEDRQAYIDFICKTMIPRIALENLAESVDVFCETGVFSITESEQILLTARQYGLQTRVHADELTPLGGTSLAVRTKALSADHLLCITDEGVNDLASSETVGVLLPGTALYLKAAYAPARKLIDSGATIALATDFNPGSCTIDSPGVIMFLAAMYMEMTADEILKAFTLHAAMALGRASKTGVLAKGYRPDLVVWNAPDWEHIIYHPSVNHAAMVFANGHLIHETKEFPECIYL